MKQNSEDEQALIKIQHDWAKARIKGDGSYTRRLEAENCTVVWPDGSIVNKREDVKSMTGDIGFTEFQIDICKCVCMETPESSWARARSRRTRESKIFWAGNSSGRIHL
jgi:hypothetical protein